MMMMFLFGFILTPLTAVGALRSTNEKPWFNCSEFSPASRKAYISWSVFIPCNLIYKEFDYNSIRFNYNPYDELECRIWKSSKLVFKKNMTLLETRDVGMNINNFSTNQTSLYTLALRFFKQNECVRMNLTIKPEKFNQIRCQDHLLDHGRPSIRPNQVDVGRSRIFSCFPTTTLYLLPKENATLQWQRNCSDLPQNAKFLPDSKKLLIRNIDFIDAGRYTCSVTYNGMTHYSSMKKDICVEYPGQLNKPIFSCSTTSLQASIGENRIINCTIIFGKGRLLAKKFKIVWRKVPKNEIAQPEYNDCDSTIDGVTCLQKLNSGHCYMNIAPISERKLKNATIAVFLNFTVTKSTFGRYKIFASAFNIPLNESIFIEVEENRLPMLFSEQTILVISIALLILIFVLVFLAYQNKVYVKVFMKRLCGKNEIEQKSYGASFAYYFSRSLDVFAQEKVKNVVYACQKCLEELGCSVFDEFKDGFGNENCVERLKKSVEESHRLLVFLSHEFIKNDQSFSTFLTGFDSMINSGSKMIFILLPGTKAYLKQHAHEEMTCQMVLRAIKLNYWIECAEPIKMRRLKVELELAMPKLSLQKCEHKKDNFIETKKSKENEKYV